MNLRNVLGVIIGITLISTFGLTAPMFLLQQADAIVNNTEDKFHIHVNPRSEKAPIVISGENVYITWWTNKTANNNEEVIFRASTDGGATFGDKIDLSNTTDADSTRVEIAGEGSNVIVSWWETNQTSDVPVMRVSTDNGSTFGPMLRLATNGTIGESSEAE
jgi:hypothetical protein